MQTDKERRDEAIDWAKHVIQLDNCFEYVPDHSWAEDGITPESIYHHAWNRWQEARRELLALAGLRLGQGALNR